MKAIMLMFDSLNRHMLPPYGCDWVHAPNFKRLAEKTVTLDRAFVGSMPCMPARRELHTGRYNFLHRSWGPIEPFDDSMPEILKKNGVWSHLASDHYHYWEEGGCNYHTRYKTWEISRGQEGDPWIADMDKSIPNTNPHRKGEWNFQDSINRKYMQAEDQFPQAKTTAMGIEFMRRNAKHDKWFLQVETFDPHEPYFTPERFKKLYDYDFSKFQNDWPEYVPAKDPKLTKHYQMTNAALISMCDHHLGRILDEMDRLNLWKDTMLIINTDHGFLLGEHDWWGKCRMPFYNEIAQTPLFIWDPRTGVKGQRRQSLVQTIDLPATILEYFGIELPKDMQGKPLRETIASDKPVRKAGLFGLHGAHVNCTDGHYVYMRSPATRDNQPLSEYTLMPTHMRHTFEVEELHKIECLQEPFSFTKGCRTMKITGGRPWVEENQLKTMLFDIDKDPGQKNPINDPECEEKMIKLLVKCMKENDSPKEQFIRLGLEKYN
ncbi:MAG TPA: sulfatase [Lentisphaeria bacterium]|nr:MAG: sulfatase [Lentisphaerae bacterium GWF2_49_21]HBC85726.1 sulfatase [Lentisphaeria bacterium]